MVFLIEFWIVGALRTLFFETNISNNWENPTKNSEKMSKFMEHQFD